MAVISIGFALGWLKLAAHVCQEGHHANNVTLFGRIYELKCICGESFWKRPEGKAAR